MASAAALLLGLTCSVAGWSHNWYAVHDKVFEEAEQSASSLVSWANGAKTQTEEAIAKFKATDEIGQHLIQDEEARLRWLRFFKAVDVALPHDPPGKEPEVVAKQEKLYITSINTEKRDVATWWLQVNGKAPLNNQEGGDQFGGQPGEGVGVPPGTENPVAPDPTATDPNMTDPNAQGEKADPGPKGQHWVVTLKGYHYHNLKDNLNEQGAPYVRNTLIKNLELDEILIPDPTDPQKPPQVFPVKKLGIAYPRITWQTQVQWDNQVPNPDFDPQTPLDAENPVSPTINQPVFHFELQFVWYDPVELKKAEEGQGDPNDPSYVASQ